MSALSMKKYLYKAFAKYTEKLRAEDVELFLRIFREYFHRFRSRYIIIFILIFVAAGATAITAWLIKDVVNAIFVNKQAELIIPIFLFIFTVFVIKGASTYAQMVMSRKISNAMVADIQKRLFSHVIKQRISFFDKQGSDDLLMRFTQGAHGFYSILTTVLVDGSRELAMVVGLFFVMLLQDPVLTLLCFTVVPVVFYCINTLLRKIKVAAKQELEGFSDLNKNVRETVQGISVIKSFHLEDTLQQQTDKVIEGIQQRRNRIAVLQSAPVPLMDTLGGIAVGLTILYVGFRVVGGNYDPGTFMSFITALLLAADSARRLSQLPVKLKTAMIAVGTVFELLHDEQFEGSGEKKLELRDVTKTSSVSIGTSAAVGNGQISDQNGANGPLVSKTHPIIQFQDVFFGYDANTSVLNGFNLDIHQGEMIALVGPSGAGKSTLFKLLLRFYEPTSGTILINGMPLNAFDLKSLRTAISLVEQSNFIFAGTIKDNLTLGDETLTLDQVKAACRDVGLHDFIEGQRLGYDSPVGELGTLISGGQAQRLNMARAILKDSPILLLDEVTSALDAENELLIKNYVRAQAGRKTVLVIAHRLSTVKEADRIVLIENGRVADFGTHHELADRNPYYEKIVTLQFAQ